jgi:hypothetical protein
MPTARDTYNAAVQAAEKKKAATLAGATNTHQETVAASKHNVGYNNATGNFANLDSATKTANTAFQTTAQQAGHDAQVAINNARATLQATGDTGPA